jgi:hypothetical protein
LDAIPSGSGEAELRKQQALLSRGAHKLEAGAESPLARNHRLHAELAATG